MGHMGGMSHMGGMGRSMGGMGHSMGHMGSSMGHMGSGMSHMGRMGHSMGHVHVHAEPKRKVRVAVAGAGGRCRPPMIRLRSGRCVTRAEYLALHGLHPIKRNHVTIATAHTKGKKGAKGKLIAISGKGQMPSSVPSAGLNRGETPVRGKTHRHAERHLIKAAKKMGHKITHVAASRPICKNCERALKRHNPKLVRVDRFTMTELPKKKRNGRRDRHSLLDKPNEPSMTYRLYLPAKEGSRLLMT